MDRRRERLDEKMNDSFPRIIAMLRKERGLSQKNVAEALNVSQALLSHYEKGVRECGLDFVVKAADFYGVSCDYLLGRTPDRNGSVLTVDDIPDPNTNATDKIFRSNNIVATLNKKLISNSINVLYDLLQKIGSKELVGQVSSFLMVGVYKVFRMLCAAGGKNSAQMFGISEKRYKGLADSCADLYESNIACVLSGEKEEGLVPVEKDKVPEINPTMLKAGYPAYHQSLINLVQRIEGQMKPKNPEK